MNPTPAGDQPARQGSGRPAPDPRYQAHPAGGSRPPSQPSRHLNNNPLPAPAANQPPLQIPVGADRPAHLQNVHGGHLPDNPSIPPRNTHQDHFLFAPVPNDQFGQL